MGLGSGHGSAQGPPRRRCVGLRWYASPAVGGREGRYLYDPAFIRRPLEHLPEGPRHCRTATALEPGSPGWLRPDRKAGSGSRPVGRASCWAPARNPRRPENPEP